MLPENQGPNKIVRACLSPADGSVRAWAINGDRYHIWATGPATASIEASLENDQVRVRALYDEATLQLDGSFWFIGLHLQSVDFLPSAQHAPMPNELTSVLESSPYQFRTAAKLAISKRYAGTPDMGACASGLES
jgi:hypothetical protein